MRKLDQHVFNLCTAYVDILGQNKDPYVTLMYTSDDSVIKCFKEGGSYSFSKCVGVVGVKKTRKVCINSKSDASFIEYLTTRLEKIAINPVLEDDCGKPVKTKP